ncbi:MAG: lipoyl(octanoyl) transferase LipB [Rikenellaceae bacterium]|nr:lipoyl(octanoyl) transferase LipB [Rikenellaceae bacterium]
MTSVLLIDKGITDYSDAWEEQKELFSRVQNNMLADQNYLMLCEHPHVYTLGKSGNENNLLVNDDFLRSVGATYFKTDRGGDITYHGYGQLVGYPILNLNNFGLGLKDYIELLEETVIRTIADYGINGGRLAGATGVWIETDSPNARKICAIGVKASRFVTMHGFALNVNTDLKYFSYINPCGFIDKGVTSIQNETGKKVDMDEVKIRYVRHFAEVYKCKIK